MALEGLTVLEMAGLAPAPFCGMVLADFGAEVIRVDRAAGKAIIEDTLCRGKKSLGVNLKTAEGIDLIKNLAAKADVIIEPFRKGVMEKLGLGPDVLTEVNPRLIYARLTGFGQTGPLSSRAGHDINYLAISGTLSAMGRQGTKPYAPVNLLADFAGGGLMCALGVVMALLERHRSGKGQVIDANMVEGAAYVGTFLWATRGLAGWWGEERGTGWLDGGSPWYDTYQTGDGLYMSVGAIEPQFYAKFIQGLGLSPDEAPQFGDWAKLRETFTRIFKTKTQEEWCAVFEGVDACVMPVVPLLDVAEHNHNASRGSFVAGADGSPSMPRPAPRLSRTPAEGAGLETLTPGSHTREVLLDFGYDIQTIRKLAKNGVIKDRAGLLLDEEISTTLVDKELVNGLTRTHLVSDIDADSRLS